MIPIVYLICLVILWVSIVVNFTAAKSCRREGRKCQEMSDKLMALWVKFDKGLVIQQNMVRRWSRGIETFKAGNTEAAEHFLTELQQDYNELKDVLTQETEHQSA